MSGSWRRPVGAAVDVKELEYISALHQTCLPVCREDATVSSIDIVRFLRSRFALEVEHKDAIRIVRSLGGGVIGPEVYQRIMEELGHDYLHEDEKDEGKSKNKRSFIPASLKLRLSKAQSEKQVMQQEKATMSQGAKNSKGSDEEEFDDEDMSDDIEDPEKLQEEYLDLVQLLSIILMPTIARAGKEFQEKDLEPEQPEEEPFIGAEGSINPVKWYKQHKLNKQKKKAEEQHKEEDSLRPKPEGLIKDVLQMMLGTLHGKNSAQDNGGDVSSASIEMTPDGPILNDELVTILLEAWGEHERSKDTNLIHAMVEAAGGEGTPLNEEAFVRALTSDLSQWQVGVEDRLSTTHYDVWGYDSRQDEKKLEKERDAEKGKENSQDVAENGSAAAKDPYIPKHPLYGANIDFAVDCHASITLTAVIWLFFVCTALVYTVLFNELPGLNTTCEPSFGCQLVGTIWVWFTLAIILSLTGLAMIVPLSLGNTPVTSSPMIVVICFFCAAAFTYIPYITVIIFRDESNKSDEPYNSAEEMVNNPTYDNIQNLVFAIGNAVMFAFIVQFIVVMVGRTNIRQSAKAWVRWFFTSHNVRGGYRIKKAATRKVNAMLENAHALHPEGSATLTKSVLSSLRGTSSTDETMLNFVLKGESQETCGGLIWTWKKIFDRTLFDTEGVWINTRIIVFQTAQVIGGVAITYSAFVFTEEVADAAEKAWQDLVDLEIDNLPQWIYDLVPTRTEVYGAFYPANAILIIVMIALWLLYVPSAVGTTLKYRCGRNPALKSRLFNAYRGNADTVYLNIGNALYGMVGSAVLFWALTALVVFLFVWDFTRDFMLLLVAWGIGLTITIVLKMIMTMFCRKKYYAAYYRTHPFSANLSLLALECWFIGLGGGILIGRLTQFILAAFFWVGRIDVRFLDERVNLVGYGFDYVPFNFEKDLLGHDAHRHPFIDRLGAMYMLKLKDGNFCTDAGACWRQLFVVSLMPWMMKYRVFNDTRMADAIEAANRRQAEIEGQDSPHTMLEDAKDFGEGLMVGLATGGQGMRQDSLVKNLSD